TKICPTARQLRAQPNISRTIKYRALSHAIALPSRHVPHQSARPECTKTHPNAPCLRFLRDPPAPKKIRGLATARTRRGSIRSLRAPSRKTLPKDRFPCSSRSSKRILPETPSRNPALLSSALHGYRCMVGVFAHDSSRAVRDDSSTDFRYRATEKVGEYTHPTQAYAIFGGAHTHVPPSLAGHHTAAMSSGPTAITRKPCIATPNPCSWSHSQVKARLT
ncbi:MAG: hypothetical protein JWP03_4277, partial [Phycisphaerales bacterium]|nr:hypothetical protein [Phycisphaerales bacterium]